MSERTKLKDGIALTFARGDDLGSALKAARSALSRVVYPPDEDWDGKSLQWTSAEFSALCCDESGKALSHVGAVLRQGKANGANVKIGGIGSVMTHPDARRQGLAAAGIDAAVDMFRDESVDFGFLVCAEALLPLYGRLGWKRFDGDVYVTQRGKRVLFTFNHSMVLPICAEAPDGGEIDLLGPPW